MRHQMLFTRCVNLGGGNFAEINSLRVMFKFGNSKESEMDKIVRMTMQFNTVRVC